MHKVKKKNNIFILNNITMVGDFNIKKFLTENKVTVASQRLAEFEMPTIYDKDGKEMGGLAASGSGIEPKMNELDVQDPQVTDSVKEFYELQQEMNTMKSRLKEMEARFKGFEGVIKPMLDEMKELGDKLAMAGEFVIKVTKFGGERMDASYKDAFENALSKVNAATKNVLQEALEASKKVTQVKHSIDIQPANSLQEGIMDRITGAFKGILSRLDQKVNNAAKAVEDFINLVADNVPGGEDVDDTPNPVLEDVNPYEDDSTNPEVESAFDDIIEFVEDRFKNPKRFTEEEVNDLHVKLANFFKGNSTEPVLEKLSGNQDKLDKNNDGKISGEDFKMMKKEARNSMGGGNKYDTGRGLDVNKGANQRHIADLQKMIEKTMEKIDGAPDNGMDKEALKKHLKSLEAEEKRAMMKKEAINPAQQAAIAISKKENVKEELGMRTKEVPNEHAGKYFVKGRKTGENVKSGFNTQDEALKWARENMRQAEYSVHKHKDTKRVYTKD
jgi:hypothetical protein